MSYIGNIFVSLDQFGNTIAGGNPDNTISARIGNFNHPKKENGGVPFRWKAYRIIVDWAFKPIDGEGHCHEAYHNDAGETYDEKTSGLVVSFLTLIIVPICFVLGIILHFLLLIRIVKPKKINRTENIKKRLTGVKNKLNGTFIELNEEETIIDDDLKNLTLEVKTIFDKVSEKINTTEEI